MLHVVLLPFLSLSIQPRGNPPYAQSFLLTRITYCPDNALCISEAIKLPRGFFASLSRPLSLFLPLLSLLPGMSLRLRGGKLRKSFPREFVTPVAETAIHSCPVSRNSFREYNTERKRLRRKRQNEGKGYRQKYSAVFVTFQIDLLSAFTY